MLDAIFKPRSIAVVGASRRPGTIGWQVCDNVIASGFDGQLFPVNPGYQHVHSIKCWASVADIPDPVDLAILAVPADHVLGVARDCAAKGVGGLVVISAGFAERAGDDTEAGERLQDELVSLCREHGMRLIGPNCMGVVNTDPGVRMNATFARTAPLPGNVAFMSQSGALGEAILAHAARLRLGISMFASVGNRADVSAVDLLAAWREDPRTSVVLLYLESFGDPRRVVPELRQTTRRKPVIAVKAGRSEAGRRAVMSHTGSLAGADATVDALFEQCGVLRARSVPELFDLARALSSQPLPRGNRVAVVTNAGGPGALAADALEGYGLELPRLSEDAEARIRSEVMAHASVGNPVDLLAGATPRHYRVALDGALADPGVDAVLAIFVPPIITDARGVLEAIADASKAAPDKPILACVMAEASVIDGVEVLHGQKIPLYGFPEAAAAALDAMVRYARWREEGPFEPVRFDDVNDDLVQAIVVAALMTGRHVLTSDETFRVLDAYGIPTVPSITVGSPHAARRAASETGYPVALKVASERLTHKSDVRGVALDLRDGDALEAEMLRMHGELKDRDPDLAFSIQPMVTGGVELIAGFATDPQFGAVVMFGLGGIHAESIKDVAFRVAPLSRADAEAMVDGLRASDILRGTRGRPPLDRERLVDILLRLGQLAVDFPEITELDVNPLLAFPEADRFRAVDARAGLVDQETLLDE
ncbi:MAG: acetate--CoA ligase family protein [Myxococcota bacterium]